MLLVLVAVVALLFWSGVHNLRSRRMQMQQAQQQQVTITKDTGGEPESSKLHGKQAPAFTLVDLTGKKVSLSDFKGKPVVVNFWATWCGPCKLEMPWLEEFANKYKGQGLVVLGIDGEQDVPKDDVSKVATKLGVTYPILLSDNKVLPAYGGVDYFPETFYIDRNGLVIEESAGAPPKDEMEGNIRKVIAAGGQ